MTSIVGWILLVLGLVGTLINGPGYIRIKWAARHMRRESNNDSDTFTQAMTPVSEYFGGLLALSLVFVSLGAFLVLR